MTGEPTPVERLREAFVGEPPRHGATIDLAEYDPVWPQLYEREAARVRSVLGDRVLLLEHVGSTSVPGLPAKPLIDMLLVVPDSADEAAYVADLEAAGYRLTIREPDWHEHRLLKGPDTNINLHVYSPSSDEPGRMLAFRDHLRRDKADRELYLRSKRELAAQTWEYVQHYADAKTAVVEEILSGPGLLPAATIQSPRGTDPAVQRPPAGS